MRQLSTLLDESGCSALLIIAESSRDPFIAPFVGSARLHKSFVVAPREGPVRLGYFTPMERGEAALSGLELLTPEALDIERWSREGQAPCQLLANVLSRGLQLSGVTPGNVALSGLAPAGQLQAACGQLSGEGWSFQPGGELVQRLRRSKSEDDLASMRKAAEGSMAAMRRVAETLAGAVEMEGELWLWTEKLKVTNLKNLVAETLASYGLEQPEGNIIAPAEEGAVPHNVGTEERALRPGESLVVDLFPRHRLFSDCTRTFCFGEAPEALQQAHAVTLAALQLAHERTQVGASTWQLQEAVCEHIQGAGYPTPISEPGTTRGYVHGLGHGVGYAVHELPSFRKEADEVDRTLQAGDVITLEPGIYEPEQGFAVRLEDMVALTDDGAENLTPLPYDLNPAAW